MGVVKKRDSVTVGGVLSVLSDGGEFKTRWPGIWEMLSSERYGDGELRKTSTVTLFVDSGAARVCLNDRDNGLTGWSTGTDLLAALDALEAALANDRVEWRAAGQALPNRKRRA